MRLSWHQSSLDQLPTRLSCHPTAFLWVPGLWALASEHKQWRTFAPVSRSGGQPMHHPATPDLLERPHAVSCASQSHPQLGYHRWEQQGVGWCREWWVEVRLLGWAVGRPRAAMPQHQAAAWPPLAGQHTGLARIGRGLHACALSACGLLHRCHVYNGA